MMIFFFGQSQQEGVLQQILLVLREMRMELFAMRVELMRINVKLTQVVSSVSDIRQGLVNAGIIHPRQPELVPLFDISRESELTNRD
jgi:hypothetical protein